MEATTARRFVRQFQNPLIYILPVAGATTAALGEVVDSSVIFGVVLINAVVGFIQESKAEAALDSLRAMVRTESAGGPRGAHGRGELGRPGARRPAPG